MVKRLTMSSHPLEGGIMCEHPRGDYVLYSDFAKLAAENERMKHCSFLARVAAYFDASDLASSFMSEDGDGGFLAAIHRMTQEIASLRAEALSRTGAVKVLPRPDGVSMSGGTICLDYADYDLRDEAYDWLEQHASHPRDTNTVDDHETANVSDKPEGQQELGHSPVLKRSLELMAHSLSQNPQYQALTRPSEQAVTEAMVDVAARAIANAWGETWECCCTAKRGLDCDCGDAMVEERDGYDERLSRDDCRIAARAALKAAMEAGG